MQNKKVSKLNIFANKRRVFIVSLTVVLVLLASVGTTLAFLAMKTQSIKNVFAPVTISCQVQDDYKVANTGDYSAYIRAAVVVNYVKDDDSTVVHGVPPVEGTDYTLVLDETNWDVDTTDGFYYYKTPVNSGNTSNTTTPLVTTFAAMGSRVAPEGYSMKVQIIAEAIQSNPVSTVKDYWNVTVDGTTISK